MWKRWGLGPVFEFETVLNARRRQVYEGRALFVLLMLIGLIVVWFNNRNANLTPGPGLSTNQQLAKLGEWFFYTMAGIQISLVMLVAPAATAESICIDRARGTLTHMLMTDLSDVEIVLGKLGARLAPVIGMIACGVPVAALTALLGGIEFGSIAAVFAISLALAVLGCSLAIAVSVWATKTHDVLIALYIIEGLWLLALPLWSGWASSGRLIPPPEWFQKANPYVLLFAPFNQPGFVGTGDYLVFIGVILTLSAGLAILSVVKLRRVEVEQSGRPQKHGLRLPRLRRIFPSWAGPSLDGNPVLWREWHRNQPSRLARVLWVTIFTLTWILAAWGTYECIHDGASEPSRELGMGMWLQLIFGMLILSATAPTLLAEERVRGSLDVLLSTPLSTRSIVRGKWLGACRSVLALAILPLYSAIFMACTLPDTPLWLGRFPQTDVVPLTVGDRILAIVFCGVDFVVSCAMLVGLGLLIATWVPRLGRAVALSVVAFFLSGIGWVVLVQLLFSPMVIGQSQHPRWLETCVMSLSPIFGPMNPVGALEQYSDTSRAPVWICILIVILTKVCIVEILLWLTIKTFDRCMGRVSESRFPERVRESAFWDELVPNATH
jgi:ABC-type transport system involved in multi-copper enzyme maturation permease subunit